MQRLLSLGQRRPPFPSGFFNSSCARATPRASTSSSTSSHCASQSGSLRLQSFSDSSRSRPPKNNSNRPTSTPAKDNANAKAVTATSAKVSNAAKRSEGQNAPATTPTSSRKARSQRANSRTGGRSGKTRIDPFSSGIISAVEGDAAWLPKTIEPVPILHTMPQTITLDSFYSLDRPLLEVTVAPGQRRSPSSHDRKPMDVVGESEHSSRPYEQTSGQSIMHDFAEEQIGEYDLHLVTEPEGADPEWAEGTDKHLASLEHNVLPPAPSPSTSASAAVEVKSDKKVASAQTQQESDVDYLFPYQAEARKAEEEMAASMEKSSLSESLGAQISRMLGLGGSAGPKGDRDPAASTKFLVGHLMKHKWSGMWEWEPTRRALSAVEARNNKGKARAADQSQGEGAEQAEVSSTPARSSSNTSMQKSVESLRRTSRARARANAKAARRGQLPLPHNGQMLHASSREDLQQLLGQLAQDPSAQGRTIFIQMPMEANFSRRGGKSAGKAAKETAASSTETTDDSKDVEDAQAAARAVEEEVSQVVKEVARFQGFFNKSVDADLQTKAAKDAHRRLEQRFGILEESVEHAKEQEAFEVDAQVVGLEWDAPQDGSAQGTSTRWFSETSPSQSAIEARFSTSGPRLSTLQAARGRSLRWTLEERLALRGIELVGPYKWIEMDSVKRKRRKRISRHKYKKRRKATRAERRKAGK